MSSYDILIACSSWEDRFVEGVEFNAISNEIDSFLFLGVTEFVKRSEANSAQMLAKFAERVPGNRVNYISAFDDVGTWRYLDSLFREMKLSEKSVLLDVSTMPRYLIWYVIHFLHFYKNKIDYCYFPPNQYEDCEWLTDEPLQPRLIFKHSGEYLPNRSSVLVVQSGFDVERVSQLIRTYEPEKLLLGIQKGTQLKNLDKNMKRHKERLNFQEIENFEIDSFSVDHGYSSLEEKVTCFVEDRNILVASFGPKITAVEIMKLNMKFPAIGLIDVPVRSYNERYSHGIDVGGIQKGTF